MVLVAGVRGGRYVYVCYSGNESGHSFRYTYLPLTDVARWEPVYTGGLHNFAFILIVGIPNKTCCSEVKTMSWVFPAVFNHGILLRVG